MCCLSNLTSTPCDAHGRVPQNVLLGPLDSLRLPAAAFHSSANVTVPGDWLPNAAFGHFIGDVHLRWVRAAHVHTETQTHLSPGSSVSVVGVLSPSSRGCGWKVICLFVLHPMQHLLLEQTNLRSGKRHWERHWVNPYLPLHLVIILLFLGLWYQIVQPAQLSLGEAEIQELPYENQS